MVIQKVPRTHPSGLSLDGNPLAAFDHLKRPPDLGVSSWGALALQSGLSDEPEKRQRAAVHDGDFQVINFYEDVIHLGGRESGEQVLRGGDQYTLFH